MKFRPGMPGKQAVFSIGADLGLEAALKLHAILDAREEFGLSPAGEDWFTDCD